MDRVHHIAKWICVFCFEEKSSVVYDWTVFRCNHLLCLSCFRSRAKELKRMFECLCGAQFPPESAYDYVVTFTSSAREEAEQMSR